MTLTILICTAALLQAELLYFKLAARLGIVDRPNPAVPTRSLRYAGAE